MKICRKKLNDKDTLFKDIFVEKVTKTDESVRKFTGLPSLEIFNFVKDTAVNVGAKMKYWTGSDSEGDKRYQCLRNTDDNWLFVILALLVGSVNSRGATSLLSVFLLLMIRFEL